MGPCREQAFQIPHHPRRRDLRVFEEKPQSMDGAPEPVAHRLL